MPGAAGSPSGGGGCPGSRGCGRYPGGLVPAEPARRERSVPGGFLGPEGLQRPRGTGGFRGGSAAAAAPGPPWNMLSLTRAGAPG